MNDESISILIAVALGITVLVIYFVMAANINRIKKDIIDLKFIAMRYAKKDGVDLERKRPGTEKTK
jgi:hypothetical protein